jgi:hypothetical protein
MMKRRRIRLGWALALVGFGFIVALGPLLGASDALSPFEQVERRN